MPTCLSCGRESAEGDQFCRVCGHELPAPTAPVQTPGGPLIVATFGPTTGWVGKTISYEGGAFTLEGVGPLSAPDVLTYDRQVHLVWAYAGLQEWVQQQAATSAATFPNAIRGA